MRIGILSDIHDHKSNLLWALDRMKQLQIEHILCLGDVVSPFIAKELAHCSIPTFLVFGNNDGDRAMITKLSHQEDGQLSLAYREFAEFDLERKTYFLSHYPELAESAALSGKYVAAFHGHTHKMRKEILGNTPILCPGEICGLVSGKVSFAIFDTTNGESEFCIKE